MKQVTIEINNSKAMRLIENLADLKLITLLKTAKKPMGSKLSDRLEGSITASQAKKMQVQLKKMRKEWERDI